MNGKTNIKKMVLAALFTAMTCVATVLIKIEMPATNGYVNLGDCFVLLGAWMLGPVYGAFAGGVGSALADLLSGYPHYIPGTLLIKAAMALTAALLYRSLRKKSHALGTLVSGIAAEAWMTLGYFLYAALLLGKGLSAALSVPGNLVQGAVGMVSAMLLVAALRTTNTLEKVSING